MVAEVAAHYESVDRVIDGHLEFPLVQGIRRNLSKAPNNSQILFQIINVVNGLAQHNNTALEIRN